MIPVVTPAEMAAIDRAAPEPTEVLVRRAAAQVTRRAIDVLGGTYGRRALVVAGPGNNGEDGRVAASMLRRRGVAVEVLDATRTPSALPQVDLVIDAAFGTGFRGSYDAPDPGGAAVLAVDIPSGLSGLSGEASGTPVRAHRTVTFAALKPGLLLGEGPSSAGVIDVVDIGLSTASATVHLVETADAVAWVPQRAADAHKWRHAVWVVAGSPGMSGAARLCCEAALRAGAGYVRLSTPGEARPDGPTEAVAVELGSRWSEHLDDAGRFGAVVLGPGLGRSEENASELRAALARLPVPVVVDGDGLAALDLGALESLSDRPAPTVLTPHDGEFAALAGAPPGADRIESCRQLSSRCGAVVLLKGPTTVVAEPGGATMLVRAGDQRLATAGTGDVLSGLVAAHLALGAEPLRAAASAAHVHGSAAAIGHRRGLVASDLPSLVARFWDECSP